MSDRLNQAWASHMNPVSCILLLAIIGITVWVGLARRREFWPLLGVTVLILFNFLFSKNFLVVTGREGGLYGTPINILHQGSEVMLLAIGMTMVIAVGGIDLSVGSVMALSGALAVICMKTLGYSFAGAATVALFASLAVGLLNGSLVAGLGIQPIVATLITMVGIRGVAMLVTGAEPVTHTDPDFLFIGNGHFLGFPFSVTLVLVVFALACLATRKTALGLFMEASGDNETASHLAGVPAKKIKFWLYGVSGLCAGVAGLIAASFIETADPDRVGRMKELDAIFAVVVGGTALTGGRFFLVGTFIGGILIQTLSITMYNQDVPSEIEPMPKAIVILIVCLFLSPEFRRNVLKRRAP